MEWASLGREAYHSVMLDSVKVGDWLTLNVRGVRTLERVTRVSDVVLVSEHYKFTRSGLLWPARVPSITARPALQHEILSLDDMARFLRYILLSAMSGDGAVAARCDVPGPCNKLMSRRLRWARVKRDKAEPG